MKTLDKIWQYICAANFIACSGICINMCSDDKHKNDWTLYLVTLVFLCLAIYFTKNLFNYEKESV